MRTSYAAFLSVLMVGGCAAPRVNPSFPLTLDVAKGDWKRMCEAPVAPPRPVVVVGGYSDPGFVAADLNSRLRRVLGPEATIISTDVGFAFSMDAARDRLVTCVQAAAPAAGSDATVEVDVVAVSMGGLVARYAALPREGARHLCIARLFTVSSPHSGARMAQVPTLESRVRDMRKGSPFLTDLDGHARDFELIPYARLDDWIVGAENAAPPRMNPWWVETPVLEAAHLQAHSDPRILADIARRLRGEEPFTHEPPSPLPSPRMSGT